MRHKPSQNARVLYTLFDGAVAAADEVVAVVDALMRVSFRTEGGGGRCSIESIERLVPLRLPQ